MSDTQTTTTFRVAGMTCNHCVATIRKALETALPGATPTFDLTAHTVTVAGDAEKAAAAITAADYAVERIG